MADGDVVVDEADYKGKALVGRIGLARRTHYLLEVAPTLAAPTWAASLCGAWAGGVELAKAPATCARCAAAARQAGGLPATRVRPAGGGA